MFHIPVGKQQFSKTCYHVGYIHSFRWLILYMFGLCFCFVYFQQMGFLLYFSYCLIKDRCSSMSQHQITWYHISLLFLFLNFQLTWILINFFQVDLEINLPLHYLGVYKHLKFIYTISFVLQHGKDLLQTTTFLILLEFHLDQLIHDSLFGSLYPSILYFRFWSQLVVS